MSFLNRGIVFWGLQIFNISSLLYGIEIYLEEYGSISSYAARFSSEEMIVDENGNKSLMPASCMKIVTTAAALHLLGPDYRFETHLEYDGNIDKQKTLHGNIYIHGGGDPCLGSDRVASSLSWERQIKVWVNAIKELGIEKIKGNVIGDASRWERSLAVPSWAWEDLGNYYGAGACALSFHENYYSLFFSPGIQVGSPAKILWIDPFFSKLIFQNEVTTGPVDSEDEACIYGSELSPIQRIRGTIPAGVNEFLIKGSIPDPAAFCADLLTEALKEKGIFIEQQNLSEQKERIVFHTTYSPTIKEIVYWTNHKSINLYAEHLLKKMGEVAYGEGSTSCGIKAVTNFLAVQGIDLKGFNMVDGSGLSRKNLITAKQLVSVLLKMQKSEFFPVFFESLPEKNSDVRGKSGSMSLVGCYAGYAGDLAFACLVNQCLERQTINEKIQQFISALPFQAKQAIKKEH